LDPDVVRYVGKTAHIQSRHRAHLYEATRACGGSSDKSKWIRGVIAQGGSITITVLESGVSWSDERFREKFHIARCLSIGHPLTNVACRGWQESATPKHHLRFEARDALAYWAF